MFDDFERSYRTLLLLPLIMAYEGVPQPFPNLKIPQWRFQMKIDRLKDEATSSFWKAVEADGE